MTQRNEISDMPKDLDIEPEPTEIACRPRKKPGRPMKYTAFLERLSCEDLYTPAKIVREGREAGLLDTVEDTKIQSIKIRHTLARLSRNRGFPKDGDGMVAIPGQASVPGWYGKRWKTTLPESIDYSDL